MTAQEEIDLERLKKAVSELGEHFDTVQIFATRYQSEGEGEEGTVNANYGAGNWFARMGFVRDWLIKQDEYTRVGVRKDDGE
jgi:hypothetical protein